METLLFRHRAKVSKLSSSELTEKLNQAKAWWFMDVLIWGY